MFFLENSVGEGFVDESYTVFLFFLRHSHSYRVPITIPGEGATVLPDLHVLRNETLNNCVLYLLPKIDTIQIGANKLLHDGEFQL